jgi:hypothetical protein
LSKRTKIALLVGLALVVTPVGVAVGERAAARFDTGASPGDARVPSGYSGINDSRLLACMRAQAVCDPQAEAELKSAPWASPLPQGAPTIARAKAEQTARGAIDAPADAATYSQFMTGAAADQRFHVDRSTNVDESRPVWIVTVKARVFTDGSPSTAPQAKDSYSAVVDAGSGLITDDCIGCAWLTASG